MKDNGDATAVFWDINRCPIPNGFDARWVRPSIKRFLRNLGYSGPLTVTAVGALSGVPFDILGGVYSSGICLANVLHDGSVSVGANIMLTDKNPPPANIMVISDPRTFPCFYGLLEAQGYNILQPFPYDSLHSFFHPDSCALEAVESAWWKCFICPHDPPAQGSDNFTTHLAREEHHQMQFPEVLRTNVVGLPMAPLVSHPPIATTLVSDHPPMNIRLQYIFGPLRDSHDLKAVTVVFWDINMCPIPTGVDARWVGPRIKQFLEKSGYSGPLTITAVGALKDVPNGILGELFSSRISLDNVAYGSSSIEDLIFQFQDMNPPPANIMVISDPTIFPSEDSGWLQSSGYNLIQPYPYDSLQSFLPTDSGELDCMEVGESASWVCSVCRSPPGQVFENFTTHLSSQVHERKTLGCRPRN